MPTINFAETESVASVTALRAVKPQARKSVHLQGQAAAGDGGERLMVFDPASSAADNGVTVVQPTGLAVGRFLPLTSQPELRADWFGLTANPAAAASAKLQDAIELAISESKPLLLRGGRPYDSAHGYLVDTELSLPAASGLVIRAERGFARLIRPTGEIYDILQADGALGSEVDDLTLDHLCLVGDGLAEGAGLNLIYATNVQIPRLLLDGIHGISVQPGCRDLHIDVLIGRRMPEVASAIHAHSGLVGLYVGYAYAEDCQEVLDTFNIEDVQVGTLMGRNVNSVLELSSSRRVQVGRVWGHTIGAAVVVKNEIGDSPMEDVQIGQVQGYEMAIDATREWIGTGIFFTNSIGIPVGSDPDLFYTKGVHFGTSILRSTQAGSKGIEVLCEVDARPPTDYVTFGRADVHVQDRALLTTNASGVDLGKMKLRSDAPAENAVYLLSSPSVRGEIEVTTYGGGAVRINDCQDAELTLRQRVAQDRVAASLEGRPTYGVLVQATNRGRLTVDIEDTLGKGLDLATDTAADAPSEHTPLVLTAQRIKSAGSAIYAEGYDHLRILGLDGGLAPLEAGAIALHLIDCSHRVVRARVRSTALASSTYGAAYLTGGDDLDDRIDVVESPAGRGVTCDGIVGGGRLEVRGGECLGALLALDFSAAWDNTQFLQVVGRGKNCNLAAGFVYGYQIVERHGSALVGLDLDLAVHDDQASATTKGVSIATASGNPGYVIASSRVALQLHRCSAGDYVSGEALIDAATCAYTKVTS